MPRCLSLALLAFGLWALIFPAAAPGQTRFLISTVAGSGTAGYSGDGGPAVSAQLNDPIRVAVDAVGNLYIDDYGNNRIRKVDTTGIITTVAGNGLGSCKRNSTGCYSGDGGPATLAQLNGPFGVALDAFGDLYIADDGNNRIRKVDANGIITVAAGNGALTPYGYSCSWCPPGWFYIEGYIGSYSGDGGPASAAGLNGPGGVTVDAAGDIYIADSGNQRIRKVNASGIITTVAGGNAPWFDYEGFAGGFSGDGGPATSAELNYPLATAVDAAGNLYIADPGNNRVREVDARGIITTVAGNGTPGYSGDGGPATEAALSCSGIAMDGAGNIFIADAGNNAIRRLIPTGNKPMGRAPRRGEP
jgi:sugar lactone lactonase YvrE